MKNKKLIYILSIVIIIFIIGFSFLIYKSEQSEKNRIKNNIQGKRVNFSGRSVITADTNIEIDEIGIPYSIAMDLTIPVKINKNNTQNF